MVIECIGLPGSGKSYLMKQLERALLRRGCRCVNVSELCMTDPAVKAVKKLMHAAVWVFPAARALREDLEDILAAQQPVRSRFGIYENARFTEEAAAIFCSLYPRMMRSETVFLFDEGLAHTLVKYCADTMLREDTLLAMYRRVEEEVKRGEGSRIVVCNRITVRDCMRSIEKRDRHVCDFDELTGDALREILQAYRRYTECIAREAEGTGCLVSVRRRAPMAGKIEEILRAAGGIKEKKSGKS